MSFSSLLAQTCTIETLTDGTVTADRRFVRSVVSATSKCRLKFDTSAEPDDALDGRPPAAGLVGTWTLFLPAGTAITSASRVLVDGVRYRVNGAPNRVQGARAEHHVQASLLLVSDVEG